MSSGPGTFKKPDGVDSRSRTIFTACMCKEIMFKKQQIYRLTRHRLFSLQQHRAWVVNGLVCTLTQAVWLWQRTHTHSTASLAFLQMININIFYMPELCRRKGCCQHNATVLHKLIAETLVGYHTSFVHQWFPSLYSLRSKGEMSGPKLVRIKDLQAHNMSQLGVHCCVSLIDLCRTVFLKLNFDS